MKRWMPSISFIVCIFGVITSAKAEDVLELRSGGALKGKYLGGSADTIKFEADQTVKVLTRQEVSSVTFGAEAQTAAAQQPTPAAAPAQAFTLPAGSLLLVRMQTQVSSNDAAGRKFDAVLQNDLLANETVIAKAGTPVFGRIDKSKQAGRLAGKSDLALSLTELNLNGKVVPIATTNFSETGKGSFRKTARNVGVGAVVGKAFDDDDGAKKGAAIGAGASLIRKGDSVTVPVNAVLEFRLTQPLTLNP